jgi:hypothetical protein
LGVVERDGIFGWNLEVVYLHIEGVLVTNTNAGSYLILPHLFRVMSTRHILMGD